MAPAILTPHCMILTQRLMNSFPLPDKDNDLGASSPSSSSIVPSVNAFPSIISKTSSSAFFSSPLFQNPLSKTFLPTHSIPCKHQSSGNGGAHPLVSMTHRSMCCGVLCLGDTINPWLIIIFLGMTVKNDARSAHGILRSSVSRVGWCLKTVARNDNRMVRYGFKVDRAYWDGLRVGCRSTDDSIRNTSCSANLKAGGWSGIPLLFESSQVPATPSVCDSASASGKVGDFITKSLL